MGNHREDKILFDIEAEKTSFWEALACRLTLKWLSFKNFFNYLLYNVIQKTGGFLENYLTRIAASKNKITDVFIEPFPVRRIYDLCGRSFC